MATQAPLLPPGQWVQLTHTTINPAPIGIIRQAYHSGGGPYYQVVWYPGSQFPKSAMYQSNEISTLTPDQAAKAIQSYNISQGNVSTQKYNVSVLPPFKGGWS